MSTTVRAERLLARRLPLICATAFALAGCAVMHQQEARDMDDVLVAAGFTPKPADTPDRARKLQAMPPLKMISQAAKDGRMVYGYADPYSCNCLYVGDQQAYEQYVTLARAKYERRARSKQIRDKHLEAQEAEDNAAELYWGFGEPWENSGL